MSASYETIADYITTGNWEDQNAQPHSFDTSGSNVLTVDVSGLDAGAQALARRALDAWETVADIRFSESGDAQITFTDTETGAITYSSWTVPGGDVAFAEVNVPGSWVDRYGSGQDSYAQQVYIHEIGHALGLGHVGLYDTSATHAEDARFENDSWHVSVMSYFSQTDSPLADGDKAYAMTPMMADILAIQDLYGASTVSAGDTVYGTDGTTGYLNGVFRAMAADNTNPMTLTLHDTGGTDTLDLSFSGAGDRIDLGSGSFSTVGGVNGALGIAGDTVIENAIGGEGGDAITGNAVGNLILSRGGDDTLRGGAGDDTLYGGTGEDQVYGGAGDDELGGAAGHDIVYGGTGNDTIYAGTGDDVIGGAEGADDHWAGAGHDTVYAASGDDRVGGGLGDDELWAGTGADSVYGADGADRAGGGSGADALYGGAGEDSLYGVDGDDLLGAGDGNDEAWGGDGADTLNGGDGADSIYGGDGSDVLDGGAGNDILSGGSDGAADVFVFAAGGGSDTITDFGIGDALRLDADLWSGGLDADAVVGRFASVQDGDVVFAFDGGERLELRGVGGTDGLADDLLFT
ncbi:serralysin [Tranquillimonas rosea]|uniref:Serralysin n=1 Tax=Tranquillimonas rosea TaxID=641238 RepID=A0A1H9WYZ4_9RHOB|nr:M10 family metallopeptidase C-terminal domain-containing protein [Tranquillimonas rosea]SES39126.1 serralysin [Tranquillimonas rosea]